MIEFVRRPSGLLVPPERRVFREHCAMLGFEAVGAAGVGGASPWQSWTGAIDGAATQVLSNVVGNLGGTATYSSLSAIMVSDTKGLACGMNNASGSTTSAGPTQIALFTVSDSAVTLNTTVAGGGGYFLGNGNSATLVRLDDTRVLAIWTADGGSRYICKARVITIDPVANTISLGTEVTIDPGESCYAGTSFLLAPDKVICLADNVPYPFMCSISGSTVSVSYPFGRTSDWGFRGGGWRIDDTHLWTGWQNGSSVRRARIYSVTGTTATLLNETDLPSAESALSPVTATKLLGATWNGSGNNYFPAAINPTTYAYSQSSNYGYSDAAQYGRPALLGIVDGLVQLWHGVVGGQYRVVCMYLDTSSPVLGTPVTVYAGSPAAFGIRMFPTSPTKALAFYQVGAAGYVKVLRAA